MALASTQPCKEQCNPKHSNLSRLVVVVVQFFLSGIVPLAEMAGFSSLFLPLLALRLTTLLNSGHPPSSNQSLSPSPLGSSRSSLVFFAFACHSLQDPEKPSKHCRHPSSAHVHTIEITTDKAVLGTLL